MEVRARAPGKIILSGEHAVVHGASAVAASIDLSTQVSLRVSNDSESDERFLKLHLMDMGLEFSWPIDRIKEMIPQGSPFSVPPTTCSPEFIKSIASLVEEKNIPEAKVGLAAGVSAFLFLYLSIQGCKPAIVVVTSDLPSSSGLGSSAALCVSLAAALLALSDSVSLSLDSSHPDWLTFGERELELVNSWAFEGEKIFHGKPSGIDNTVSTYGNMIMYQSGKLTPLKSSLPLRMLITNTKVGRNTKALVAGVSERTLRHPDAMAAVFNAVDSISKEISNIIQSPAPSDTSITEKEEKLEELIEMNQGLLQCMGVTHASIETVRQTTLKYKLSSKLTGAGGGGCVLTLLPTLLAGTVIEKVIAELESCGFQCLMAGIGGKGVEICIGGSS